MFDERIRRVGLGAAVALALCAAAATAPARADDGSGCQTAAKAQKLDTTWPINIQLLADQLIVYRCTDYIKDFANALAPARGWLQEQAPLVDKPAIVLDIDETSLSNWEAMYHNRFAYFADGPCDLSAATSCGEREWELSARANALGPTLDLFRFARTLTGKGGEKLAVFFVTGRYEDPSLRIATLWNLRKEGYDGWEKLFMRPPSSRGETVSAYKTRSRTAIEAERYTILANIGDQLSDLVGDQFGDHAERCFKLPNPFYFIPGDPIPPGGPTCLSR